MSAFASLCASLPVSLLIAADALEASLSQHSNPAERVEELFVAALLEKGTAENAVDAPAISLLRFYLAGISNLLDGQGQLENEKQTTNELKMFSPLPGLVQAVIVGKAKVFKEGEKVKKEESAGVSVGRLQGVSWKLGVMSSCEGAPVGTVLLTLTTGSLDGGTETVTLELPVDEFMKFKSKMVDVSREMRLA